MKKYSLIILGVVLGGLATYFLMGSLKNSNTQEQSQIITYQIKKLNKLIVAEQTYSDVYSHENNRYLPGLEDYFTFDKKVILLVNAKVQATYNLKDIEIEVDSVQKTIYIKKIPSVELKIYPDVQFFDLEQSTFNSFEKDELNGIKNRAIEHIKKSINEPKLKKEAHEQLISNLGDVYLLAKIYGWKVEDKTPYAKELELKYK